MPLTDMTNLILADLPGLPRALVGEGLQRAYEEIARKWPFLAMEADILVLLKGVITSPGTISVVNGDAEVVGDSTTFITSLGYDISDAPITPTTPVYLRVDGSTLLKVETLDSETVITLDALYHREDAADEDYALVQNIYPLGNATTRIREIVGVTTTLTLKERSGKELDQFDPVRRQYSQPTSYSNHGKQGGVWYIEVWPIPSEDSLAKVRVVLMPETLGDVDDPKLPEDVIIKKARCNLATTYLKFRPDMAKMVSAFMQLWKSESIESIDDLIHEDMSRRSIREQIEDRTREAFSSNPLMYDGESY